MADIDDLPDSPTTATTGHPDAHKQIHDFLEGRKSPNAAVTFGTNVPTLDAGRSYTSGTQLTDKTYVDAAISGSGNMPAGTSAGTVRYNQSGTTYHIQDAIYPEDYGAAGDGTTDDYAALNAAYQAARKDNGGPGIVVLPGGTSYALSQTLIQPNGVDVVGWGSGKNVGSVTGRPAFVPYGTPGGGGAFDPATYDSLYQFGSGGNLYCTNLIGCQFRIISPWTGANAITNALETNGDMDDRSIVDQVFIRNDDGNGLVVNSGTNAWFGDLRLEHIGGVAIIIESGTAGASQSDHITFGRIEYDNNSAITPESFMRVKQNHNDSKCRVDMQSVMAEVHTATTADALFMLIPKSTNEHIAIILNVWGQIVVGPNAGNKSIFHIEDDASGTSVPEQAIIRTGPITNRQSTGGIMEDPGVGNWDVPPVAIKHLTSFTWNPRQYNGSYTWAGGDWNESASMVRNLNVGAAAASGITSNTVFGDRVLRISDVSSAPSDSPTGVGTVWWDDTAKKLYVMRDDGLKTEIAFTGGWV